MATKQKKAKATNNKPGTRMHFKLATGKSIKDGNK